MDTKRDTFVVGESESSDDVRLAAAAAAGQCSVKFCDENGPLCLSNDGRPPYQMQTGCTLECLARQTDDEKLTELLEGVEGDIRVTACSNNFSSLEHTPNIAWWEGLPEDELTSERRQLNARLRSLGNYLKGATTLGTTHIGDGLDSFNKHDDDTLQTPTRRTERQEQTSTEKAKKIEIDLGQTNEYYTFKTFIPFDDRTECVVRLARDCIDKLAEGVVTISSPERKAGKTHLLNAMCDKYRKDNPENANNCAIFSAKQFMKLYMAAFGHGNGKTELKGEGYNAFVETLGRLDAIFIDNVDDLTDGSKSAGVFMKLLESEWADSLVVCTFRDKKAFRKDALKSIFKDATCNLTLQLPDDNAERKRNIIEIAKSRIGIEEGLPISISGEYKDLAESVADKLEELLNPGDWFNIDSFIFSVRNSMGLNQEIDYEGRDSVVQYSMFETSKKGKVKIPNLENASDKEFEYPKTYHGLRVLKTGTMLDQAIEDNIVPDEELEAAREKEAKEKAAEEAKAKKAEEKKAKGSAKQKAKTKKGASTGRQTAAAGEKSSDWATRPSRRGMQSLGEIAEAITQG
jgi:hypothetical protein